LLEMGGELVGVGEPSKGDLKGRVHGYTSLRVHCTVRARLGRLWFSVCQGP
jgi:hypothetical protein